MRVRQVLQLLVLLVGVCPAHHALLAEEASTSWEAGEVPLSQMRMLSLGLAHLLHGVEENAGQLERRGEQAAAELDGVTRSVETLHKQSLQAGRTHRQARKDLQILSARGDRLWRTVKELQKLLEDLETEQRTSQHRLDRVLRRVRGLTEPGSGGRAQPDVSSMKVVVDKQTRRLASLTSVVSARDKLIDRRLQRIEHLEKHARNLRASDGVPAALRPDSDSDCV
ncbi:uncharacterized protein LOC117771514 [Hippoglossus hippoglossus]|uniref:uncharacterized protein LOC117771514 n=1 Tax=Hippoglossus hippoglossus TaxID=8267 RepID=UPI00148B7EA4|nr:uncharacterized protein LOC117771514 [Hippoglossus hippoglossus]